MAQRTGETFDEAEVTAQAGQLLTVYFHDIVRALAPRFDHVRIEDYTLRRIQAIADQDSQAKDFVHIDQQFDMWFSDLAFLWAVKMFNPLSEEEHKTLVILFIDILDMPEVPLQHEFTRERVAPLLLAYPETLKVAHALSVAGIVSVICHELAHHELGHVGLPADPDLEYQADALGFELMKTVYGAEKPPDLVEPQRYSLAGAWFALRVIDFRERRQAHATARLNRLQSENHPLATERLHKLSPLLAREMNESLEKLINGFASAGDELLTLTGLDQIG